MPHFRRYFCDGRILVDTHDLRLGLFYVKGHAAWLHLPCLVIRLKGSD